MNISETFIRRPIATSLIMTTRLLLLLRFGGDARGAGMPDPRPPERRTVRIDPVAVLGCE